MSKCSAVADFTGLVRTPDSPISIDDSSGKFTRPQSRPTLFFAHWHLFAQLIALVNGLRRFPRLWKPSSLAAFRMVDVPAS